MPDQVTEMANFRQLLLAMPGTVYLLDKSGQVLDQNAVDLALRKRMPADSQGKDFFVDVIAGGGTAELGGTFYAAMADAQASLDVDLDWRIASGGGQDVRIRLRKIAAANDGEALALAIVEDATRQKTTERALSAAMGEGRDEHMHDPVTRMFSRAQFDFGADRIAPRAAVRLSNFAFGRRSFAANAERRRFARGNCMYNQLFASERFLLSLQRLAFLRAAYAHRRDGCRDRRATHRRFDAQIAR